ncbi:MAG: hypothetical protein LBF93_00295 [Zoogloeaceae bacterium]|jgi:hypothetical protein|nr:hypothetical protein [Zoogloeaceae bacterium]
MDLSTLPLLSYTEAEAFISGKAGKVQNDAEVALESKDWSWVTRGSPTFVMRLLACLRKLLHLGERGSLRHKTEETELPAPNIRLHEGDLVADDLDVDCECLIVNGNLHVKGLLATGRGGDENVLIVLGDAHIGRYSSWCTYTIIRGNLTARHIVTNSLNDLYFAVGGNLEAESFADFGEAVVIHGNFKARVLINREQNIEVVGDQQIEISVGSPYRNPKLRGLIKEELLTEEKDEDGEIYPGIDEKAYRNALEQNRSPFIA